MSAAQDGPQQRIGLHSLTPAPGSRRPRKDVPVKMLAKGELSKALTVHAHAFSAAARERIEAAGGSCKIIDG